MGDDLKHLLEEISACRVCADLPLGPRPVLQASMQAKILVAAQAPGVKVHNTGIPFNDPSGDRLRAWMGIGRDVFYDKTKLNIIPMGFCYPGKGSSGDLPPRPECRKTWHGRLFQMLPELKLTLVIGQYAHAYHLEQKQKPTLTETARAWRDFAPEVFPLPHPSPRNSYWLRQNPWFEREVIPALKARVKKVLKT
ncbi:MAG: uracil-DNA glycosylase family protein [Proteobacteria bacterium]|nr:uracil-DNA glycosylase family protein [Pseudomonadota bacterium]